MKVKLKYPIFSFAPKGNMIYVFRKEKLYTTTNTELLKKRKNYIVVDATGTKYVEKGAHKVKWQGIFGYCIRMQGRVISIEYEYGGQPRTVPTTKTARTGSGTIPQDTVVQGRMLEQRRRVPASDFRLQDL